MKTPCIHWVGSFFPNGYGKIYNPETQGGTHAHRYFYAKRYGSIPKGLFVCHHCDTPDCVNVDHLFLGTPLDNVRDAVAKGRFNNRTDQRGENNHHAKLTNDQAIEIRKRYAEGDVTQEKLAAMFEVNRTHISRVVNWVAFSEVER